MYVVSRWSSLLEEISERLRSSKALLQLWQHYKELYGKSSSSVQLQEEQADRLLETACTKDITDEEVSTWIQDCSVSSNGVGLTVLHTHRTQHGAIYCHLLLRPFCLYGLL